MRDAVAQSQHMSFVKLDCGMLKSSIWWQRDKRDIFITALLMAVPFEVREPMPQLKVRKLERTKFTVPKGWYGFVDVSPANLVIHAMVSDHDAGLREIEEMGEPDGDSKSQTYDGRRMVRVAGGFIILNYMEYRERDHSSTERSRRWRAKQKAEAAKKYDMKPGPGLAPGEGEHLKEGRRGNRRSVA